jgi:hypothetical protein
MWKLYQKWKKLCCQKLSITLTNYQFQLLELHNLQLTINPVWYIVGIETMILFEQQKGAQLACEHNDGIQG